MTTVTPRPRTLGNSSGTLRNQAIIYFLPRLPPFLADHHPLATQVTVSGAEGTKDSTKNRERVGAKLAKPGLEVVVTDCSTPGLLMATFSYNGKNITFSKKKDGEGTGTEKQKVDVVLPPAVPVPGSFIVPN